MKKSNKRYSYREAKTATAAEGREAYKNVSAYHIHSRACYVLQTEELNKKKKKKRRRKKTIQKYSIARTKDIMLPLRRCFHVLLVFMQYKTLYLPS